MNEDYKFLGCFSLGPATYYDDDQLTKDLAAEQGKIFRTYIWGENGISAPLKKIKGEKYGKDLVIILFEFYVKPIPYLLQNLKAIENYRRNEKSIGIPIVINDENFFNKPEKERCDFLAQSILEKLDILVEVIKKKKLDTDVAMLKADVYKVLNNA